MPTRQCSALEVSTASYTGIVLEDDIMEHTSDLGIGNNGEDDDDLIPPLKQGTIADRGDDEGDDDSASMRTLAADHNQSTVKEVCLNQRRLRRSRNRQIMV